MLTENSIVYEGIKTDPELFKKKISLTPFEEDEEPGNKQYGYLISHSLLDMSESVKGKNQSLLPGKIQLVVNRWISIWNSRYAFIIHRHDLQTLRESLDHLLHQSLDNPPVKHADDLKTSVEFEMTTNYSALKEQLDTLQYPAPPKPGFKPPMPMFLDPEIPISKVLLFGKKRILNEAYEEFDQRVEVWLKVCEKIDLINAEKMKEYEQEVQLVNERVKEIGQAIELKKADFMAEQQLKNEQLNLLAVEYSAKQKEAVENWFDLVLKKSPYPLFFPKNAELAYIKERQTLEVTYELPHPDQVPKEKELEWDDTNQTGNAVLYGDEEFSQLYNDIVYKIILRIIHEIFSADYAKVVDGVRINGWVTALNKGNGQFEKICIASLYCMKQDFEKINLKKIEPSSCFKFLRGVSSPSLAEIIPIPQEPLYEQSGPGYITTSAETESQEVQINIANLNMQEFEKQLISLFEMEFGMESGDIKLRQELQDGSFEASGTDKEFIRGGRFIIQARKTTKPVGINAVKELYGSVMHEGAMKGILVTTSDFFPEVQEFVMMKPIILLNGSQLLLLFEKHGTKARISFREAISLKSWLS